MARREEPPERPRCPLRPYVEAVVDADDVGRQNAGRQNPKSTRSAFPGSGKPGHATPTLGQFGNPSNTGAGSVGKRANVSISSGPTISTWWPQRWS